MLIKFIDHKDKTHWVNPAYIKSIKEKGTDKAQIEVSGWAMGLVIKGRADEVAGLINLAVQEAALMGLGPIADQDAGTPTPAQLAEETHQAESSQAAIFSSVVIGG